MRYRELKKTGICKGDWTSLDKAEGYTLWEVLSKEGTAHEVVTLNLYGEDIIVEVDEKKIF